MKISNQNQNEDYIDSLITDKIGEKEEITKKEIRQIVDLVLSSFGIFAGQKNAENKQGILDIHRKTLAVFCSSPSGGLELLPLRPGSKVEIMINETWQTVDVIADETGRAMLNLSDDVAPIGAPARIPLAIKNQKINLLKGGRKNE